MTQEPKLWKDMTPEEKGALLLAHHEGKDIESFGGTDWYRAYPSWADDVAYRVKPEPKREKVTALICLTSQGVSLHMETSGTPEWSKALYATVTFDTIGGKPDPASLKIEEVAL
jgi:hypothetical protein